MIRWLLPLLLPAAASAALRAGAAVTDITPVEWPVRLIGNFGVTMAPTAHDPLHVRALVLEDGGPPVVIAVIDSCYVKRDVLDEAKQLASTRTGIPASRMLISATHTHSAPPSGAADRQSLEGRYVTRLIEQTAAAIANAHARLAPAAIAYIVRPVPEELFNRRWFMREGSIETNPLGGRADKVKMNPAAGSPDLLHPAGTVDPGFSVVSVQNQEGRPIAVLANYSLHYVGGVPANQVSADYFGEYARQTASRLAPNDPSFVAILSNGTSGDVNNINFQHPRPRSEPFHRIQSVAFRLAAHTAAMVSTSSHRHSAPIQMAETDLELRYRKPTAEQLRFARAAIAEPDAATLPRLAKDYAERAVRLSEGPDTALLKLQALRIGGFAITAIPCETFTEIGLAIKDLSPVKPVFTIELANGHYGYLPTPRHYELGGYETWLGTNVLEPEAAPKITNAVLALLRQVQ